MDNHLNSGRYFAIHLTCGTHLRYVDPEDIHQPSYLYCDYCGRPVEDGEPIKQGGTRFLPENIARANQFHRETMAELGYPVEADTQTPFERHFLESLEKMKAHITKRRAQKHKVLYMVDPALRHRFYTEKKPDHLRLAVRFLDETIPMLDELGATFYITKEDRSGMLVGEYPGWLTEAVWSYVTFARWYGQEDKANAHHILYPAIKAFQVVSIHTNPCSLCGKDSGPNVELTNKHGEWALCQTCFLIRMRMANKPFVENVQNLLPVYPGYETAIWAYDGGA